MNSQDPRTDGASDGDDRWRPPDADRSERIGGAAIGRWLLHAGIVGALVAGVRRRDPSVIVNGCLSLLFARLPGYLTGRYGVRFKPWHRLWVSAAALVHTVGMLGPYDRVWWWDHLAHTISGVVVAAAADIVHRAGAVGPDGVPSRASSRPAAVVGITLAFGAVWELFELIVHAIADRLGFEPLLVHYGRLDAIGDLVFDALGAGLVLRFGRGPLSDVVDSVAEEPVDRADE